MTQIYKLLALDLDGTLVDEDLVITNEVKSAIKAAIAKGVIVTLATGRMFRSARLFSAELGLVVPLICYQGAMVRHSATQETIYHKPLELEAARRFIDEIQKQGYHLNAYVDDQLYVARLNEEAQYYAQLARVEAKVVGDLLDFIDRPDRAPTKLVVVSDQTQTAKVVDDLQAIFGDSLYITRSHARFTEAVNPECSKGVALAALAQSLDIKREAVIAIGDNLNDLPMLEYAGLSVAVANAVPFVREKVQYVASGKFAAGVVEAINRFVL